MQARRCSNVPAGSFHASQHVEKLQISSTSLSN
jgi:hypothetical protein